MIDPVIGWVGGKARLRKLTAAECAIVIQQLTHRKSRIRWMAADLLGKQRVIESIGPLVQALHDPQWLVRLHAAKALGRIGDPQAFSPLQAAILDDHPSVRRQAIRAFGQLPDERVIPVLLRILQHDPTLWSDVSLGLTNFVVPYAASLLMRATTLREFERYSGMAVRLGQPFIPLLLILLKYSHEPLQRTIVKLLGRIGDQRTIPTLRSLSSNPRSQLQHAAHLALAHVQYRYYEHMIPRSTVE